MRIGDLARMAGSTPRAIRHYHRAGVLPEPPRMANGYRRYELADLVRVARIRWLLAGGLSLREVRAVLDQDSAEGPDLEGELLATLDRITAEQARLTRQERLLRALLARVRSGERVSAVTAEVLEALEAVGQAATAGAGPLLDAERAAVDYLTHQGIADDDAQQALAAAYQRAAADPEVAATLADLATRLEALAGTDPAVAAKDIEAAAELLDTVLDEPQVQDFIGQLQPPPAQGADDGDELWLTTLFPDPAHRAVITTALARRRP